MQFPCELVVWRILPAIKARVARNLKEKGMPQKDIAKALDSTEAAISQYLSGKRAADFKISAEMNDMLDVVSDAIAKGKNQKVLKYGICQVCKEIRTKGYACDACKTESGEKGNCDLCMK
jgi:uncharacterized protein